MFQIWVYFLCKNCNPLEKSHAPLKIEILSSAPFSQQPRSNIWDPVQPPPPFFENLAASSQKGGGVGGAHYDIYDITVIDVTGVISVII